LNNKIPSTVKLSRMEFIKKCLLCNGTGTPLYAHLHDRLYGVPGTFNYSICPKCGFSWLNPRYAKEDVMKCYPSYFTRDSSCAPIDSKKSLKNLRHKIRSRIIEDSREAEEEYPQGSRMLISLFSKIHTYYYLRVYRKRPMPAIQKQGRLLDIGCGNGHFLFIMKKRGWKTIGVEIDPESVRIARELYKLTVFNGELEDAAFPDHSFDAITLTHVLEHIYDPLSLLEECHRILSPEGHIYITTPNLQSMGHLTFKNNWFALEPPRHLYLWTPQTLYDTLKSVGFEVSRCKTSANGAAFIHYRSKKIEKKGETDLQNHFSIVSSLFGIRETMMNIIGKKYGEEIQLIGKKSDKNESR
jgi:2-polyprenyl-3-methyl-5-hydroxy-6-metoxy-1,4-benzoquinol methylase